jgi:hypothetical protein
MFEVVQVRDFFCLGPRARERARRWNPQAPRRYRSRTWHKFQYWPQTNGVSPNQTYPDIRQLTDLAQKLGLLLVTSVTCPIRVFLEKDASN